MTPSAHRRPPPLPTGGTECAATGERGKFERVELLTAGYRQSIRPCGEQWHLHKHTNTTVAFNSQNRRTNKRSPLDFFWSPTYALQNLCFYRLSCNLHITNFYSSLCPTRILILTHAQLIRTSITKKELSYNVPLELLKHIIPLPRIWFSNSFPFFRLTDQVLLS